ncbi:MAG: hypothetical protein R8G34_13850 [Paracoccaceae bacterium]|nr:hypothetical protein [Paracoccaceae bacterium]
MKKEAIPHPFASIEFILRALKKRPFGLDMALPAKLLACPFSFIPWGAVSRLEKGGARTFWSALAFLAVSAAPLSAQDFSAILPAQYGAEYEDLLSDPGNLERLLALAQRAEVDATQSGSVSGYRFAIRLYERMLFIDPDLTQVALRLGEIHYRLGEFVEAGSYFQRALQDPELPPDVRAVAERYIDRIDQTLAPSQFSGRLVYGLKYQSNPTLQNEPLLTTPPQGSDFNLFAGVGLSHVFDPGWQSGHTLETTLDATAQKYFEFNEIDSTTTALTFGPRLRLDSFGVGNTSVRPYLAFTAETVSGDWYSFDTGGGIEITGMPMQGLRLSADFSAVSQRHNAELKPENRLDLLDGDEFDARLGADFQINPRLALGVGMSWRETNFADDVEFAITDRYSRRYRAEVFARYRHPPLVDFGTGDWYLNLSLSHQQTDWFDSITPGSNALWREDWENTISLSSEVPVTPDFAVVGGIGHTGYNSTLAIAEYSNWEMYLGFRQQF